MDKRSYFTYHWDMFGFLIKKNFYDLWDNMFRIILINLGFILSMAVPLLLPGLLSDDLRLSFPAVPGTQPAAESDGISNNEHYNSPVEEAIIADAGGASPASAEEPVKISFRTVLSFIIMGLGLLWCFIYLSTAALTVKSISDYGSFGFSDFIKNLKAGWPAGLTMGLAVFLLYLMIKENGIIQFYLSMDSMLGLFLAAVIFWTMVIALLSLQFFFTIRARLDTKLRKVFKKSFIIFFDNPGFAIFIFLNSVVSLVLSAFFALLIPGPAGMLLFTDEALRLRLMKYDWLEANPESVPSKKRRKIPWDAILIEEREKTGNRSFKSFIFPWKD